MIRTFRSRVVATAALVSMVVSPTTAFANDAPTACPDGQVASSGFADTEGTVHEQNIDCILHYGITQGLNARTYGPSLNVSRAQMATFLARTIDLAAALPAATDQGFQDIRGTVHEDRINQLAAVGVANGTSATSFSPNLSISRGQMAVFLVRAWEASTDQVLQRQGTRRFSDTEGTAFADAIDVAFEMGWTKGTSSGLYSPGAPVSRGAMASFIARFLEDLSARGSIGKGTAPSLTAFTIGDNDGSGSVTNGDTLTLKFDQDMIANSSITIEDEDGTKTIIDDVVALSTVDGRTRASLTGSGTNTLVFTLLEAPDFNTPGGDAGADSILNGVITVIASEGISGVNGQTWVPTRDAGNKSTTLAPVGGGGGGGGGGGVIVTPPAAPTGLTVSPSPIGSATKSNVDVSGSAEDGSTVTVVMTDGTNSVEGTNPVSSGTFSVLFDLTVTPGSLLAPGTITVTATATNTGGTSPETTTTVILDETAPVSPTATIVDGDGVTNQLESEALTVSGSSEDGSTVTVNVTDGTLTVGKNVVASGGAYDAILDVSTLADGTITATAVAKDAAGNTSPTSDPDTSLKDTTGPAVQTVMIMDGGDEFVNASEAGSGISVQGTVDAAADSVEVALTDGITVVTSTAGLASCGAVAFICPPDSFSADFTATQMASLVDGPITAVATATDGVGNSETGEDGSTLDTTPPPAPHTFTFQPDPVNLAGQTVVEIGMQTEAGTTVTITAITDQNGKVIGPFAVDETATPGTFSTTEDLHTLADGPLTVTASAVDAAGQSSPDGFGYVDKDSRTPEPGPTVVFEDELINAAEAEGTTLTGFAFDDNAGTPAEVEPEEDGTQINITITDINDDVVLATAFVAGGNGAWTATGVDVTSLADGTITATVKAVDAAGNESIDSEPATSELDQTAPDAPTVTFDDDRINAEEAEATTVSGTAPLDAVEVELTITDGVNNVVVTATVTAGAWGLDVSVTPLADGIITATAIAFDTAGNASEVSLTDTATLDTTAPAAPVILTIEDGDDAFVNAAEAATPILVFGTAEPLSTVELVIPNSLFFDFDSGARVPATSPLADLSKGHGPSSDFAACCNWFVQNGSTQVVTPVPAVDLSSAICGPADGYTYSTDSVGYGAPASNVVCLQTAAGDYFAYTGQADCCGAITIDWLGASTGGSVTLCDQGWTAVELADCGPDLVLSTTTNAEGEWQVNVDMGAGNLADGTIVMVATATDLAGNDSKESAPAQTTLDTVAPQVLDLAFDPAFVNASTTEVFVTGTTEATDLATVDIVVFDDSAAADIEVSLETNATSFEISVGTLGTLTEGPISAEMILTDLAGNSGTAALTDGVIDRSRPAPPTIVHVDDPINVANVTDVLVTGTAANDGSATVTIVLTDEFGNSTPEFTTDVTAGLDWALTVDASALADDADVTVTATAFDAAGNPSTSDAVAPNATYKDATAPDAPVIISMTDPINAANQGAVTVTFTASSDDVVTDTATATLTDSEGDIVSADSIVRDGVTFVATFDLTGSAIGDGTVTATAQVFDEVSNSSLTDTMAADKDTDVPVATAKASPDTDGNNTVLFSITESVTLVNGTADFEVDGTCEDAPKPTPCTITDVAVEAWLVGLGPVNYEVRVTLSGVPTSAGTITMNAGAIEDGAGNPNVTATATYTDTIAPDVPTVVVETGQINLATASDVVVTVTATPNTDVDTVMVTLTDGTLTTTAVGATQDLVDPDIWVVIINSESPVDLADGSVTATATVTDTSANSAKGTAKVTKDTVGPTLDPSTTSPQASGTSFTFVLSEAVTSVEFADFAFSDGLCGVACTAAAVEAVVVDGDEVTLNLATATVAEGRITITAGAIDDLSGNPNLTDLSIAVSAAAPAATGPVLLSAVSGATSDVVVTTWSEGMANYFGPPPAPWTITGTCEPTCPAVAFIWTISGAGSITVDAYLTASLLPGLYSITVPAGGASNLSGTPTSAPQSVPFTVGP